MKYIYLTIITAGLLGTMSCRKDYTTKPSPFHRGDTVALNGITPAKSFVPYDCCVCPCVITSDPYKYTDERFWYYDIVDTRLVPLTHVDNKQLRLWKN